MAGRPKRRAQLEQQSLSTPIPDALSTPEPMRAPAPARARMREAPTPIRRGGYLGASSRAAADSAAATELNGLAQALRPGAQVRIERVRPSWAAGWIEDLTLDVGGLGELYEHLQEGNESESESESATRSPTRRARQHLQRQGRWTL